jgi:hypothetical protein
VTLIVEGDGLGEIVPPLVSAVVLAPAPQGAAWVPPGPQTVPEPFSVPPVKISAVAVSVAPLPPSVVVPADWL